MRNRPRAREKRRDKKTGGPKNSAQDNFFCVYAFWYLALGMGQVGRVLRDTQRPSLLKDYLLAWPSKNCKNKYYIFQTKWIIKCILKTAWLFSLIRRSKKKKGLFPVGKCVFLSPTCRCRFLTSCTMCCSVAARAATTDLYFRRKNRKQAAATPYKRRVQSVRKRRLSILTPPPIVYLFGLNGARPVSHRL